MCAGRARDLAQDETVPDAQELTCWSRAKVLTQQTQTIKENKKQLIRNDLCSPTVTIVTVHRIATFVVLCIY